MHYPQLKDIFSAQGKSASGRKEKVIIVGIGNTLRGDDGLGPMLIQRLQHKVKDLCIDAGSAPENYLGKIIKGKPDAILIVDALHLGKRPGEFALLQQDDLAKTGLSTHDISPDLFIQYLKKQTAANIYILGVQPENISFGQGLSVPVQKTLEKIEDIILQQQN